MSEDITILVTNFTSNIVPEVDERSLWIDIKAECQSIGTVIIAKIDKIFEGKDMQTLMCLDCFVYHGTTENHGRSRLLFLNIFPSEN